MSQTESNSLNKTKPKPTSSLPQASSTTTTTTTTTTTPSKPKMYKPCAISTAVVEKMAPYNNPVQIGTRGTVGSLVMKEIEYFNQLELSSRGDSEEKLPRSHSVTDMAASSSTSNASKTTSGSVLSTQKKKKRGGNKLLPSMCSMVEVSENNSGTRPVGISGFGYRNLKTDVKKLQA